MTTADRVIIDHAIIERCLAQIAAWSGWEVPCSATSVGRPTFVIELQGSGTDDIRRLRAILKTLLRRYEFRCIGAREVCVVPPASPLRAAALRRTVAVRITQDDGGWLVVVGAHGWLHGNERSALADARWLAGNFDLPIRRDNREGST
jgi:hypothetical protein